MPKGASVRSLLEGFIKEELIKRGYQPVYTPHIGRLELYRTSGHFPYYKDSQFPPLWGHPLAPLVEMHLDRLNKSEDLAELKREEKEFIATAKRFNDFPL